MAEQDEDRSAGESRGALAPAALWPLVITVAIGLAIWLVPASEGVDPSAWHLLAIFVPTVAGFIAKPLPMGALAIIAITLTVITGTLPLGKGLSGFSSGTIWLIAAAFFVSRNLFSTLTHYANGPATVLYGTGYVSMGAWWGVGFTTSVVNIVIWVGVGSVWWKVVGLL